MRFEDYKEDAELLVSRPKPEAVDYIEGFAFLNSDDPVNGYGSIPLSPGRLFHPVRLPPGSGPVLYCLEVAIHYQQGDSVDEVNSEKAQGYSGDCKLAGLRPQSHTVALMSPLCLFRWILDTSLLFLNQPSPAKEL